MGLAVQKIDDELPADMSTVLSDTDVTWQIYVHNLHASYGPSTHMVVSNYCL